MVASGFLTALECTKFVFSRGSAPDPAGEAYSAPPEPLDGLRGTLLLSGIKGERSGGGERPITQIPGSAPDIFHCLVGCVCWSIKPIQE